MPYLHAINGFAYNVEMVRARMPDAPVDSLDMIFKPEIVSRFADCGVSFLDSPEDVLELALQYLHLDPNTTRREDYLAAQKLLLTVRPYIRTFDQVEYMNGLANRERRCQDITRSHTARSAGDGVGVNGEEKETAGEGRHRALGFPKNGSSVQQG